MRFYVRNWREAPPPHAVYPYVVLQNDNWDDYGYETLFHSKVYLSHDWVVDLRGVKILKIHQEGGRTPIEDSFDGLDDSYCSLGQELAYYERLMTIPEDRRLQYLTALRDAAADATIRDRFRREPGFETSLLRSGPAGRALEDAAALLQGVDDSDDDLSFTFYTRFGSNEFATSFKYLAVEHLPGRINAVIGYNGTGKTKLLANLAWVASTELNLRKQEDKIREYGRIEPDGLRFGHVITIAYSAFDTFAVPPPNTQQFGYSYCGLRKEPHELGDQAAEREDQPTGRDKPSIELKNPDEIAEDIGSALLRIDTPDRRRALNDAMQPIRDEPSVARAGYSLDLLENDEWRQEFDELSTGHKISVNIIVQLVGWLQQRSLVLIDEPEAHLHPPLLAALMKGISIALDAHRSYAIVATHSPVVLQEIAGCYAHVLRRHGSRNSVVEPRIETFGENIGLLTRHVFNLDNSHSDYEGILLKLASALSLEEIENLFEHGLSSQARALVMQAQNS